MRLAWLGLLLIGCAHVAPAAEVEGEVRALLEEQGAAWNRGDLQGFCAPYADDAAFLSPSGLTVSRQAVFDRYEAKYGADQSGMGTLGLEVIEVRVAAGGGSASVALRWSLAWPDKEDASGLSLVVVERQAAGWRVVQDASM
jgi:uncharacterized protein (TIGR02246 family)